MMLPDIRIVQARGWLGCNYESYTEQLPSFRVPFRFAKALCHATPSYTWRVTRLTAIRAARGLAPGGLISTLEPRSQQKSFLGGLLAKVRRWVWCHERPSLISRVMGSFSLSARCNSAGRYNGRLGKVTVSRDCSRLRNDRPTGCPVFANHLCHRGGLPSSLPLSKLSPSAMLSMVKVQPSTVRVQYMYSTTQVNPAKT